MIDLGITDGNINAGQEYVLNVTGLTETNFVSVSYGGKKLVSDGLSIKTSQFGKIYGKGGLEIRYLYKDQILTHDLPVVFVTKVLSSKADLDNFLSYADMYNGVSGDGIYDGYFALGADIEYNGTYVPPMVIDEKKISDKTLGFRGVFDGRGHSINGMSVISARWDDTYSDTKSYRRTGFISVLHKDGVIKNTAFTNAKVQYCSFLASRGGGVIENVYVGYTGDTNDGWNSTVNTVRDSSTVPVTMKNCIIGYDTAWAQGNILGKVNASANAYKNVYIVGAETANAVMYWNDESQNDKVYGDPLYSDNFKRYATVGELLAERKNEIASWRYFSATDSAISFGSKGVILQGTQSSKSFSGKTLISADGKTSDYIIVCEDDNDSAMEAARFIAEHIGRASGKVAYSYVSDGGNAGIFKETVTNGVLLSITTRMPQTLSDELAYIVIGNVIGADVPTASSGRYIIKSMGNTVFINADINNDYLAAAITFLEETIGYSALSDNTVLYNKVDGADIKIEDIDIDTFSAFNTRNSTNAHLVWKNEEMGLNGRNRFPIGPTDENGKVQNFHNSTYWLDYSENKEIHPKWFRTFKSGDGYDVCYAAGGVQNSSNAEYVSMVKYAAEKVRSVLDANPGVTDVTFSLRDNDLFGCSCSVCSANHTNAAVRYLNDVVKEIQNLDGNENRRFTIYMLAYYYLINAPTIEMNEHLGVIYASVRNGYEAESIYSDKNAGVRTQIAAWAEKTKNIGFWFYGTLFHDYMIYTDTVRSLVSWFEYSARTVRAAGAEPIWIYVNGQTRERNASAFEAFKQYAFSKAQAEVLQKLDYSKGAAAYEKQLDDYVLELESEFFGFGVSGGTKTFKDGGYYGAAEANKAMYEMFSEMKADYAKIKKDGTTYEYIDKICYNSGDSSYNALYIYVEKQGSGGYWINFTADMIKGYMSHAEKAQNAIAAYSGEMKDVYEKHILIESLTPRFMICVAGDSNKTNYGFNVGYNGTGITDMRKRLKEDFTLLGRAYYGEHYLLTDLYSLWGI